MKSYNEIIRETLESLIEVRHQLFEKLINVAMLNELSEINDAFDVGDIYHFELGHFELSSDINVNLLVELIKKIEQTTASISNLNNIDIEME